MTEDTSRTIQASQSTAGASEGDTMTDTLSHDELQRLAEHRDYLKQRFADLSTSMACVARSLRAVNEKLSLDCPDCGGTGRRTVRGESLDKRTGLRGPDPQYDEDFACERCEESGRIPIPGFDA